MFALMLTTGNLICGLTAVLLMAAPGIFGAPAAHILPAIWCMAAAGILDALDGPVARRFRERPSAWGAEYDALADLLSFGVAPAVLVGVTAPALLRPLTLPICSLFVICGAWRLARFLKTLPDLVPGRFQGLPITGAGLAVAALRLLEQGSWKVAWPPTAVLLLMLAASALMVSRIPYDRFPVLLRGHRYRWMVAVGVAGIIAVRPWLLGLPVALLYMAHGPARLVRAPLKAHGR